MNILAGVEDAFFQLVREIRVAVRSKLITLVWANKIVSTDEAMIGDLLLLICRGSRTCPSRRAKRISRSQAMERRRRKRECALFVERVFFTVDGFSLPLSRPVCFYHVLLPAGC